MNFLRFLKKFITDHLFDYLITKLITGQLATIGLVRMLGIFKNMDWRIIVFTIFVGLVMVIPLTLIFYWIIEINNKFNIFPKSNKQIIKELANSIEDGRGIKLAISTGFHRDGIVYGEWADRVLEYLQQNLPPDLHVKFNQDNNGNLLSDDLLVLVDQQIRNLENIMQEFSSRKA